MLVEVPAGVTVTVDEFTDWRPGAAKSSVCAPVAPLISRLENVARPLGPVVAVVVPPMVPEPVAIAAVIVMPATCTGLFDASRTWMTGCRLNGTPTCAVGDGGVRWARIAGAPAVAVAAN
jgi:hypothetical protein